MSDELQGQKMTQITSKNKTQVVVVIPCPAQGHINSLLHLSHKLVSNGGFTILFALTDDNYRRIVEAAATAADGRRSDQILLSGDDGSIRFVSIPDGMDPDDDRSEFGEVCERLVSTFPCKLEEVIKSEREKGKIITCVLADVGMSWTLEVATKLGIRGALYWPMPASSFALYVNWPKLQQNGIIDSNGFPLKNETIQLYPGMPFVEAMDMPWYNCSGSAIDAMKISKYIKKVIDGLNLSDQWLCNSAFDLEPESFTFLPQLRPIGPLISDSSHMPGLWSEDLTCLHWLDQQEPRSVVYIAFGSLAIFSEVQFQELAFAVERLSNPVLWVVRSGSAATGSKIELPDGFRGNNVKIVSWAPQLEVLSHPSVACLVSHCGWNSTMEGVINGLPFLCWPYFADQPMNKSIICDKWKIGLGFEKNENGIVMNEEIQRKVERLLGDQGIRERASKLKEVVAESAAEGGNSFRNLDNFVKWLRTSKPEEI